MGHDRIFQDHVDLPCPREEVFAFFQDPRNLGRITPPWLGFRILTPEPLPRGQGAVYDFRIGLHGLPLRWRTRILDWREGEAFTDDQERGPYARWTHTHSFADIPGGTRMTDTVVWRLPWRWVSWVAFPWVKRDVARIFAYRRAALMAILCASTGKGAPESALSAQESGA
nr:SRPBCC family protein [uncultured Holophaga sp.]